MKTTWSEVLSPIKNSEYFRELRTKIEDEYENHLCFPLKNKIFRAIELTPFNEIKVVILGQDPYIHPNEANGLAFSVSNEVRTPPSLRNIFKELSADLGIKRKNNELDSWAEQGVLLLNSTLTVRAGQSNSHHFLQWNRFTDFIIKSISERKENVVFLLWGMFAQGKEKLINTQTHLILKSSHPSPLSVYKKAPIPFSGSKPFSKTNSYLKKKGINEINWNL